MAKPSILIVAGDPSGDEHAAALVHDLRQIFPDVRVSALGGVHLEEAADHFIFPLVGIGGFGFWEPVTKLPALWKAWRAFRKALRDEKPNLVIPVDYYGFNIHVARAAKRAGIPVAYYVSPQVWASRAGRTAELAKAVSRMLVIFPFEVPLYEKVGLPVSFVGHPLIERLPPPAKSEDAVIGLLPGSRRGTVQRHLPILIGAADILHRQFPAYRFQFFRPRQLPDTLYRDTIGARPWIDLVYDSTYEKRKKLALAITVSGTAALENMLLGIPMVIMYRLSAVTYQIAKRLIRIPYVGIPNILAGRTVVPERLQDQASPAGLAATAADLLSNPTQRTLMREELLKLRARLETPGGSQAASVIAEMLKRSGAV